MLWVRRQIQRNEALTLAPNFLRCQWVPLRNDRPRPLEHMLGLRQPSVASIVTRNRVLAASRTTGADVVETVDKIGILDPS